MSDKDDLIVAGVNQKDKGIWRDFYNRYYAALCSYVEKILFLTDAVYPCGKVSVLFPTPVS
jgi:RNA polymerase sigma-70 factor (ECF subfamily)